MIPRTGPGRWLAGIGLAVALLVVASLVITLSRGDGVVIQPEGSPERVVQDFLMAIQDRDHAAAHAFLAPERREECSLDDFRESMGSPDLSRYRIRVEEVRTTTTGAEVSLRVTETHSAPATLPSDYTRTQRYDLVMVRGEWRLRSVSWPYHSCRGR